MKNIVRIIIGGVLVLFLAFISWQIFLAPIKSEALTIEEAEQVAKDRFDGEVTDTKLENGIYDITLKLDTGEYQIKIASESGEVLNAVRTKAVTPKKELSEAEIKQMIEKKNIGTVEEVKRQQLNNELVYEAVVKNDQRELRLTLHGETGEIIKQIEKDLQASPNDKGTDPGADKSNKQQPTNDSKNKAKQKNNSSSGDKSSKAKPKNISTAEAVQIALNTVSGEVDDVDLETKNGQLYYFIEIETKDDMEAEIQIHAITGEVISIEWDD